MWDSLLGGTSNFLSGLGSQASSGLDSILGAIGGSGSEIGGVSTLGSLTQATGNQTSNLGGGSFLDSLLSGDNLGNTIGGAGDIMGIINSYKNSKANRKYLDSQLGMQENAYQRAIDADEKRQALNF